MSHRPQTLNGDLRGLESIWDAGMDRAYGFYSPQAPARVALAAALVETAVDLQCLGGPAPDPPQLLLGDLCLARASRLLAENGDQRLQVGFARAVERISSAASSGRPDPSLRDLLVSVIGGGH